jgi:uncharacterized protein (TIGR00725 family)
VRSKSPYIAVCGPGRANQQEAAWGEEVGRLIAEAGAMLVCGGLGGVMDAAAKGCEAAGGLSIGILPGEGRGAASPHLTASIPTGLGEARNALVVRAADALIAISGEFGTLSEIALALKLGKPVIGLRTWELAKDGRAVNAIVGATTPEQAVRAALEACKAEG